jgi:hypothetical protein
MRLTNQNPDQLQTVFGGGFVQEQHRDEAHRNLPPTDSRAIGIAALWLVFFALAVVSVGVKTFGKVVDVVVALGSPH